jgi:hypothetical protein
MTLLSKTTSGFTDTDNCEVHYTYNGPNGSMDTETAVSADGSASWKRTYTYDANGKLTIISKWVLQ